MNSTCVIIESLEGDTKTVDFISVIGSEDNRYQYARGDINSNLRHDRNGRENKVILEIKWFTDKNSVSIKKLITEFGTLHQITSKKKWKSFSEAEKQAIEIYKLSILRAIASSLEKYASPQTDTENNNSTEKVKNKTGLYKIASLVLSTLHTILDRTLYRILNLIPPKVKEYFYKIYYMVLVALSFASNAWGIYFGLYKILDGLPLHILVPILMVGGTVLSVIDGLLDYSKNSPYMKRSLGIFLDEERDDSCLGLFSEQLKIIKNIENVLLSSVNNIPVEDYQHYVEIATLFEADILNKKNIPEVNNFNNGWDYAKIWAVSCVNTIGSFLNSYGFMIATTATLVTLSFINPPAAFCFVLLLIAGKMGVRYYSGKQSLTEFFSHIKVHQETVESINNFNFKKNEYNKTLQDKKDLEAYRKKPAGSAEGEEVKSDTEVRTHEKKNGLTCSIFKDMPLNGMNHNGGHMNGVKDNGIRNEEPKLLRRQSF